MQLRNLVIVLMLAVFAAACSTGDKSVKGTTSAGMDYTIYEQNEGPKPQPGDFVYFQAQIRNGETVVQKSRDQGENVPFMQIPKTEATGEVSPVQELLGMMSVGDSATIIFPMDTIPEEKKPTGFKGAKEMMYDLVMVEIKSENEFLEEQNASKVKQEAAAAEARAKLPQIEADMQAIVADYAAGKLDSKITTVESGLKYMVIEEGDGELPEVGQPIGVHYYGVLTDGKMFDNSFVRGNPISFPLGQGRVIKGWDEGLSLLKKGSKAVLFIPSELGYGEAGAGTDIPGGSELIFYVELQK